MTQNVPLVIRSAFVVSLALFVAGCTYWESAWDTVAGKKQYKRCPAVSILAETAHMVRYDGAGRDVIDIRYAGQMEDVVNSCRYVINEESGDGVLHVLVAPRILVERGAAAQERTFSAPYFVALLKGGEEIIEKKSFSVTATFDGPVSRLRVQDESVGLTIPLKADETGLDYHVYLGFEVDAEQRADNRRRMETSP